MSTNTRLVPILLLSLAALVAAGTTDARAAAGDEKLDPETRARIERFEKGPATVDVSKYPNGVKENYETFSQKCSQCHKLSRPINSDYALPDEWSRYIKRMMHKPGSGISNADGKKIYEFLVYDSSIRKKAMVADKIAKATPADKATAEAKIKEVHDKYDSK